MMAEPKPVVLIELNEINFDFVTHYASQGDLPAFQRLIANHGFVRTTSEQRYEELEPWIQWVTAHTGLTLAEHKVFRLGDIVATEHEQIWEYLESHGITVGAVSPMNAKHRLKNAAFFLPDPWTPTDMTAPLLYRRLHRAVCQAVNDNEAGRLTAGAVLDLLAGAAKAARLRNYPHYVRLAAGSRQREWYRSMFLDLLLTDLFVDLHQRSRPGFSSLFLNCGAHIQHHYMFASAAYGGQQRNPSWYLQPNEDPVRDMLRLYDRILEDLQRTLPGVRLMLATGLHQNPHEKVTYYWRLRDHADALQRLGVVFEAVEPRMSRDFVIRFASPAQAAAAAALLSALQTQDGADLFYVDNRGTSIFAMLIYANEVTDVHHVVTPTGEQIPLKPLVNFVAIKNGEHDGVGYFLDTGSTAGAASDLALTELCTYIAGCFGIAGGPAAQHNRKDIDYRPSSRVAHG